MNQIQTVLILTIHLHLTRLQLISGMKWGWKIYHQPPCFPFQGSANIKVVFIPDTSILQYFENFFEDEVVNIICTETNCYSSEYIRNHRKTKPLACLTSSELKVFLGCKKVLLIIVKKVFYKELLKSLRWNSTGLKILCSWHLFFFKLCPLPSNNFCTFQMLNTTLRVFFWY